MYSTYLEDGSDEEVAWALLNLSTSLAANDRSVADELLNIKGSDLTKCAVKDDIKYADADATAKMMAELSLGGGGNEGGEARGSGEASPSARPPPKEKVHVEPEIDEDGFETVVKGRKRR